MSNNNSSEIEKRRNDEEIDGSNMSFGDHLMELRQRIINCLLGLAVGFVICMIFSWDIIGFLAAPLVAAMELNGHPSDFLATGIATPFITYMKVALISGIFLTSPWLFYQIWSFVAAGLYHHEKRYVNTFVPFAAILFVLGGLFFITVVAPISMNFFLNFNKGFQIDSRPSSWHKMLMGKLGDEDQEQQPVETEEKQVEEPEETYLSEAVPVEADRVKMEMALPIPFSSEFINLSIDLPYYGQSNNDGKVVSEEKKEPVKETVEVDPVEPQVEEEWVPAGIDIKCTINEYVYFVMLLALAFGISFQMPLAVFLLGRLNLVSLDTLCKVRKFVVLGIVIFSAVLTPPDVVSQILMSIPMYVLYELGILMVKFWPHKEVTE